MSRETSSGMTTVGLTFAAEAYKIIAAENVDENVVMSPLLLEALLSLLYLGSDGATAEQLRDMLQLNRFSSNIKMANYYAAILEIATHEPDTQLQLCNKILLNENYEIAEEFQKIAQKYFHTTAEKCNLKNAEKLHQRLSAEICASVKASNGSAATILQLPQHPDAAAIVLMAANFKNKWFLPFSAYRTGSYEFHSNIAAPAKVAPMLFDDDMFVKFGEFRELDARAIELPYEHEDDMAMLLMLPNQRDGLVALERKLCGTDLTALAEGMQMESVQVLLPKFKIEFECDLRQCLEKLGVSSIFTKEANFKNLLNDTTQSYPHFSDIFHKVSIEVHESGSEASNIVAVKPIVIANSTRNKFFRADHPFYFAIRCRDITLFAGHVTKV